MARNPHPSGRPIRYSERKGRPIWRIPDTEPNVPRLRKGNQVTHAIGFTAEPFSETGSEDGDLKNGTKHT